MPSGAKKRKAAKKKISQQPNNNNPNSSIHSDGDDDVKHYNEKESDGGELSSPASQDHQNSQHPFAEGAEDEVEKREDSSSVQLVVPEKNSLERVNSEENELKSEEKEDLKSKDISIRNGGSSGSNSSSDDESHVIEKKIVVVENTLAVDSAKPVESLAEVVGQVNDKIAVGENNNGVVETGSAVDSGLQENGEKKLHADSATEIREDKLVLSFNSPNVQTSNGAEHVQDCKSPECPDSQPLVAPPPQPVQKSSLKSCCGIFELFTSSDR